MTQQQHHSDLIPKPGAQLVGSLGYIALKKRCRALGATDDQVRRLLSKEQALFLAQQLVRPDAVTIQRAARGLLARSKAKRRAAELRLQIDAP
jgi:hypothetical protein